MTNEFNISMKMSDLLGEHSSLLAVFSRMGFRFGYGDASVGDVCAVAGVDPHSFLLICKVYSQDNYIPSREDIEGRIGPLSRIISVRPMSIMRMWRSRNLHQVFLE